MSDQSSERLIAADITSIGVETDGGSAALDTASRELGAIGTGSFGIWEAGPGSDVDVEQDELFLVLQGRGEIAFEDGSVIELAPGALVQLHAGDRTTWTIGERLRKLYLAP
ncbi:cupin domain-containing protein [Nocardioides sp. BP30]|uniref:cupin domain-containing protein n=1 Tax=Nocardioides sp. BP30 TaxID=3036374 RepID=UPI0024688FCA|nr:cupin domain-containing protein [Nocardioides sp. BP30]WGL50832.1 cupin domain-containing protein [Nocardioides sp. BP30]